MLLGRVSLNFCDISFLCHHFTFQHRKCSVPFKVLRSFRIWYTVLHIYGVTYVCQNPLFIDLTSLNVKPIVLRICRTRSSFFVFWWRFLKIYSLNYYLHFDPLLWPHPNCLGHDFHSLYFILPVNASTQISAFLAQ